MKNILSIFAVAIAIFSFSIPARADSLVVDITTGVFLSNPENDNSRALLRFDLPQDLDSVEIVFAKLALPVTSIIPDSSALAISCHALKIEWDPDYVTWTDLGDSLTSEVITEEVALFATTSEGSQTAYFDITSIARLWQDGSLANNGLLLCYDNSMLPYPVFEQNSQPPGMVRVDFSPILP